MITFETQEEFEVAVEDIIRQKLSVLVTNGSDGYDWCEKYIKVELRLDREFISSDSVSF